MKEKVHRNVRFKWRGNIDALGLQVGYDKSNIAQGLLELKITDWHLHPEAIVGAGCWR